MPTDPTTAARAFVRDAIADRDLILVGGVIASLGGQARELRGLGAARTLLIGAGTGSGELPDQTEVPWFCLDADGEDMMASMHAYERQLRELPAEARDRIEAFDPAGRALAVGEILLTPLQQVAGRPLLGARRPAWDALEDKTRVDAFWDRAGIPRAPSRVVDRRADALLESSRAVDQGSGVVWTADASRGLHGGAIHLRWLDPEDPAQREAALHFFRPRAERLRVMPFLDGLPCSIHGIVFPEGELVFRPVELLCLRDPQRRRLVYCGAATRWDPPEAEREELRALARRTASALREHHDYLGPFTVDCVATERGFLPTELNARVGAGLRVLGQAMPEVPLTWLALVARDGHQPEFPVATFEEVWLAACDRQRGVHAFHLAPRLEGVDAELDLRWEGDRMRVAAPGEESHARALLGPGTTGTFTRIEPRAGFSSPGASLAPAVAAALRCVDAEFGLDLGRVEAAQPVTRTGSGKSR